MLVQRLPRWIDAFCTLPFRWQLPAKFRLEGSSRSQSCGIGGILSGAGDHLDLDAVGIFKEDRIGRAPGARAAIQQRHASPLQAASELFHLLPAGNRESQMIHADALAVVWR